jgi:hypothetical protein
MVVKMIAKKNPKGFKGLHPEIIKFLAQCIREIRKNKETISSGQKSSPRVIKTGTGKTESNH